MIVAGIVTYNPDLKRLNENIEGIRNNNIRTIIIVDNGSGNVADIERLIASNVDIHFVKNEDNRGIATALNQIFALADDLYGAEWVLTLDQDSVINSDMIDCYSNYLSKRDIASITSLRTDRSYKDQRIKVISESNYVDRCITSGNMIRVSAWRAIGGFDERLFIDMVDYDFCYRLRNRAFKIIRINKPLILHELGKTKAIRLFGKDRLILNHNAQRKYYIARNLVYLLRTYRIARKYDTYTSLLNYIIKIILFEKDDKINKIRMIIKGSFDGLKIPPKENS